jgi:hypothetical protein
MDSIRKEESGSETHLFRSDRSLACLPEFVNYTWVASKVLFASNKDDRQTGTEMHDFGNPLKEKICSEFAFQGMEKPGIKRKKTYFLLNIIKRVWRVDCETNEDHVRVWITEGSETIVVFLSGCIP